LELDHVPKRTVLSDMLALKMAGVKKSEWALLSTLEAHMCNEEQAAQKAKKQQMQAETRAHLTAQEDDLAARERLELAGREKERQALTRQLAQYSADEAARAQKRLEANLRLKEETERQVSNFRCAPSSRAGHTPISTRPISTPPPAERGRRRRGGTSWRTSRKSCTRSSATWTQSGSGRTRSAPRCQRQRRSCRPTTTGASRPRRLRRRWMRKWNAS